MGQKHAQYARVSSTSDDEPEGHGFGFQEGAATLASWKHAERRHRLRRLLILTVPALGISGLLFLLFGNSSPKHDRLVGDYETKLPTVNSGWQPFPQGSASPHIKRLATHQAPSTEQERIFTQSCIDLWISQGQLCQELTSDNYPLTDAEHFSVVSTWQNGSDARQGAARAVAEGDTSHGDSGTDIKHFRSHNELRYSWRSVLNSMADHPQALASFHLYSSDLPSELDQELRDGSVPTWLNLEDAYQERYGLQIFTEFPWNVFKTSSFKNPHDAYQWRDHALPTFNSMSVESQFPNIDTVADTFAYLCDDMFFLKPMTPSDIASPLFGPNFRLVTDGWTNPATKKGDYNGNKEIESESLAWSAWLIQERFGAKGEYLYLQHVSKVFRRSLLRELESMWAEELADTAMIKFRGRGTDINMHNLFIYFVIERHREALLWSAIVAKCDRDQDGTITREELADFISELGTVEGEDIYVPFPKRHPQVAELLTEAGLNPPKETQPAFVSADGYAFTFPDSQKLGHTQTWVKYEEDHEPTFCKMPLSCFGNATVSYPSASDLLKHVAFEDLRCGDCIIPGLLHKSGIKGLEAFLPKEEEEVPGYSSEHTHYREQTDASVAVLPLEKNWKDVDFSMKAVLPSSETPRQFVSRLLLRYNYVMGEASHRLIMLETLKSSTNDLGSIPAPPKPDNPALLGINDDIREDHDEVAQLLNDWFASQWPSPADWETDHIRHFNHTV